MIDANEMARLVREQDGDEEVSSSTVHYYTQLGILPPAVGRGKGAFAPEHLARFRLARQLRRQGRSLSEIREQLGQLPRRELATLIAESDAVPRSSPPPMTPAASPRAARGSAAMRIETAADVPAAKRAGTRTLRFRGGFALQVPPSVPDDAVARIYAAVERVLEKETPRSARGKGVSL
jgi:DNA-binding transcriptional MerR regulator